MTTTLTNDAIPEIPGGPADDRPTRGPAVWLSRIPVLLGVLLGLVVVAFPIISDNTYYQNMIILSLVFAVGASGLNLIMGYAGYTSLGQGAFIGLGGYTMGVLATRFDGVSPWLWVPLAGVSAAVVALILGLVSLRTSGPGFVIITVAFLFLVQAVAINWAALTGGTSGLTLPMPDWSADMLNWPFHYALVAILAAQLLLSWWIRRTKFGTGLIAIRSDETKAATIGVNLPVHKIAAFAASTVFVGMAGAVYGYYLTFIDPRGMFGILISVQVILSLLVGGRGTLWGPVLGAFGIEFLMEFANNSLGGGNVRLLVVGVLLVIVVMLLPAGILPSVRERIARIRSRGRAATVGARIDAPGELPTFLVSHTGDEAKATDTEPALAVSGLTKRFGGLTAVSDCSFVVPDGSITGLIGPNGSGKTTVFNLVSGTLRPDAGTIELAGDRLDASPPWGRAQAGLGRTFQITRLFRDLTVLENVVAAQREFSLARLTQAAVTGKEARAAEELLAFVGMRSFRDQPAGKLSYGQQKMVELAQVLMLDPKLILLDEPAGGINPVLIERMAELITTLNSYGKSFLIVEHNMPFVLGLCELVHVLGNGTTMASGTPDQIQADPVVIDAYLGEDQLADAPTPSNR
ncbi:branched-chain amino acid ABC transporter ATP-binding protein/permease [Enemella evansiae]|uniref:branched-chain amino acid ABC transporter ATP-binding protein/permease n=1 Tax=Enemella evansiae TaxID=2016499 RepID=UPI000B9744B8|nr:branched-chain amino acid ABC transporter ATP-binding protein/permease [Enemella evansiae]OYO00208.1 ABC transporter [Enemella evansiae]OYO09075.1 ABC transporter [Enemella evansiae]